MFEFKKIYFFNSIKCLHLKKKGIERNAFAKQTDKQHIAIKQLDKQTKVTLR